MAAVATKASATRAAAAKLRDLGHQPGEWHNGHAMSWCLCGRCRRAAHVLRADGTITGPAARERCQGRTA